MTDYTPTTDDVRNSYVENSARARNIREEQFRRWLRKVKADAIREAAIRAQESFVAEQGGIGYARVRTSWLFDEADRIDRGEDD